MERKAGEFVFGSDRFCLRALTDQESLDIIARHPDAYQRSIQPFATHIPGETPADRLKRAEALTTETAGLRLDMIATASGHLNSAAAATLPLEIQLQAMGAIFKLTGGVSPPELVLQEFQASYRPELGPWTGTAH